MLRLPPFKLLLLKGLVSALAAFLAAHYVFNRRLPWQPDYVFPWLPFLTVAGITVLVWWANDLLYTHLDQHLSFQQHPRRRLMQQIMLGSLLTIGVFSILYPTVTLIFYGTWPSLAGFSAGMLVCLVISGLVNSWYLGFYLFQALLLSQAAPATAGPAASGPAKIAVPTGSKTLFLMAAEIAYLYSSGGMVWVVATSGQKLLTSLDAFTSIEPQLSATDFFRLNRQYLVHWQSVRLVAEESNRKLLVQLLPGFSSPSVPLVVGVSRYRASAFRQWLRQSTNS